jgi:hypothetical protein
LAEMLRWTDPHDRDRDDVEAEHDAARLSA